MESRNSSHNATAQFAKNPALRMGWHHLLFLHWTTDADALRALLPRGLELDLYENRAYVGLIPFTMRRVRPRILPGLPFAPRLYEDFHETNVRTYVRDRDGNSGVWFFSLDAGSFPAVLAARSWFRLPYFWAQMSVRATKNAAKLQIEYSKFEYSSRRVWPNPRNVGCDLRIRLQNDAPFHAESGSLEHFLVERYALFSGDDRALFRGRVRHKPYLLRKANLESGTENLIRAAGIARSKDEIPHVLYAHEARVEAFALQRI